MTASTEKRDKKEKVKNRGQQKVGISNERSKQFAKEISLDLLLAPRPAPEIPPIELLKKKKRRKKRTPGI